MLLLTLRTIQRNVRRFALTVLAVAVSVAFVAGSLTLTDTSAVLIDRDFAAASTGVDLTVKTAAAFDSAMGVEVDRDPLPAGVAATVRDTDGVADVIPVASGHGVLVVDGQAAAATGGSLLSTWVPGPAGAFDLRAGRAPRDAGEVVLDARTASAARVDVGDRVTVTTDAPTDLLVVGIAGFGDADGMPGTTVALVTLGEAQRMLGLGDEVTELLVITDDARAAVEASLADALGADYAVASAQDTAAASAEAAREQFAGIGTVLTAMGVAAVLVGALLIANTFVMMVRQRRREIALVRASGATAAQVAGGVLGEAVVIGAAGALLGTGLGVAVAAGLRALLAAFGLALPDGPPALTIATAAASLAVGLGMTLAGAVGAVRDAARVSPLEALRSAVETTHEARHAGRRHAWRVAVLAAGLASLAAVAAGAPLLMLVPGAAGTLAGLALVGPRYATAVVRVLAAPLARLGVAGELARSAAARAPRRTTSTVMTLALGLTLISFVTVAATSIRAGLAESYRETITADLVVESSRAEMLGGLTRGIASRVADVPEVAQTSRIRFGHWLDDGRTSALAAIDPATIGGLSSLDLVDGSLDGLDGDGSGDGAGDGVLVAETVATERGLAVGDRVTMTFAHAGDQRLTVVGILDSIDAQALSTSWVISLDTYARHYAEDLDASVLVALAPGVDVERGRTAIEAALAGFPTAAVHDQAAAAAQRAQTVDQVLGLLTVLVGLTIVIALLGITNTLALAVVERTREIGMMRAVGATARQVRAMVLGEAALMSAIAALLGSAAGVALGAVTIRALARTAPLALTIPAARLGTLAAVVLIAGIAAGLAPAARAARVPVLTAVAE